MITKVEIENFKSIKDATVELGNFNVLIGPNNSGKTNFCSVFDLIHSFATKSFGEIFTGRDMAEQLIRKGMNNLKISLCFPFSTDSYEYVSKLDRSNNTFKEIISKNDQDIFIRTDGKVDSKFTVDSWSPSSSILHQLKTPSQDYWLAKDILSSIDTYRFIPSSINIPAYINKENPFKLNIDGYGLPAVLAHLLHKDRKKYDNIVEIVRDKFKDIEDILTEHEMIIEKVHNEKTKHFENVNYQGYKIIFRLKDISEDIESPHISDGITYFLMYLTILNLPEKPKLLIVEEPENGIHPENLKKIIGYLKEIADKNDTQVIITTHSPYLLDWVKPEEVFVFYREDGGATEIHRMSDVPNIKNKLKAFMLGELWTDMGEKEIVDLIKGNKNEED